MKIFDLILAAATLLVVFGPCLLTGSQAAPIPSRNTEASPSSPTPLSR